METFDVPDIQLGKSIWPLTVKPRSRSRTRPGEPFGSVTSSTLKSAFWVDGNWILPMVLTFPAVRCESGLNPLSRGPCSVSPPLALVSDAGGIHGAHSDRPHLIAA